MTASCKVYQSHSTVGLRVLPSVVVAVGSVRWLGEIFVAECATVPGNPAGGGGDDMVCKPTFPNLPIV